jgi:hypothetical protein
MMERETYFPLLETIKWATFTATTVLQLESAVVPLSGADWLNGMILAATPMPTVPTVLCHWVDVGFPSEFFS